MLKRWVINLFAIVGLPLLGRHLKSESQLLFSGFDRIAFFEQKLAYIACAFIFATISLSFVCSGIATLILSNILESSLGSIVSLCILAAGILFGIGSYVCFYRLRSAYRKKFHNPYRPSPFLRWTSDSVLNHLFQANGTQTDKDPK